MSEITELNKNEAIEDQENLTEETYEEETEAEAPVVEVKKDFIETWCDKRHERRVKRAAKKAAKQNKPEKSEEEKLARKGKILRGAGIAAAGVTLLVAGVVKGKMMASSSCEEADDEDSYEGCEEEESCESTETETVEE